MKIKMVLKNICFVFGGESHGDPRTIVADCRKLKRNVETGNWDERDYFQIKGRDDHSVLQINSEYEIEGEWASYRGRPQFVFTSFHSSHPLTRASVCTFLVRHIKGIGSTVAARLYDQYGSDCFQALRLSPSKCMKEIKGLTLAIAQSASEQLTEADALHECNVHLLHLFTTYKIPTDTVHLCIDKWGVSAFDIIKANPFVLLEQKFRGCTFEKCDLLRVAAKISVHDEQRLRYLVYDRLNVALKGSTWVLLSGLYSRMQAEISKDDFVRSIEACEEVGLIASYYPEGLHSKSNQWLGINRECIAERTIANKIGAILACKDDVIWSNISLPNVTPHQEKEVRHATMNRIGVLTGNPGTGKTYTVASLVSSLLKEHPSCNINIVASTGKAAVRSTEAMRQSGVSLDAVTVHSFLGMTSLASDRGYSKTAFTFNNENRVECEVLIVDEPSMLDTSTMGALFDALPDTCHVLFAGDPNQLAPVGAGKPFLDMITGGINSGHLVEILRTNKNSSVVQNCENIRKGLPYSPSSYLDIPSGKNLVHRNTNKQEADAVEIAKGIIRNAPPEYNPIWDIQVICSLNENGNMSRKRINKELQLLLNPSGDGSFKHGYHVNDKVIFEKVDAVRFARQCPKCHVDSDSPYCPDCHIEKTTHGYAICNGQMGKVIECQEESIIVELCFIGYNVKISMKNTLQRNAVSLGYGITCHKSQGSEWKVVIIMIDNSYGANFVCCREWYNTAISRIKECGFTIGNKKTLHTHCKKVELAMRKTFLAEQIASIIRAK